MIVDRAAILAALPGLLLAGCGDDAGRRSAPGQPEEPLYRDVTSSHLPTGALGGFSMDAGVADLDGDGDRDVVIAHEFRPNILLLNDGAGGFTDESASRIPRVEHDSEDVAVADFEGDGDLDIVVVSEDDRTNELYLGDGTAHFTDGGAGLPVEGTTNAVVAADLTGDGLPDLILGNNGQNHFLAADGEGGFRDETTDRLPTRDDITQDVELGDADGDGDPDLLVGNEDDNRLLLNDGSGRFTDAAGAIPFRDPPEETREADFGDVDGDGDLDVLFANVRAFVEGAALRNRLLVNDGAGRFSDEREARLPADADHSFDGDFADLDGDGDLDVITANADVDLSAGRIADAPFRVYRNDGSGHFEAATGDLLPPGTVGTGFDVEFADFDGDGRKDLYLASRGTVDRLLLRR